jgi:hypothetical protein
MLTDDYSIGTNKGDKIMITAQIGDKPKKNYRKWYATDLVKLSGCQYVYAPYGMHVNEFVSKVKDCYFVLPKTLSASDLKAGIATPTTGAMLFKFF